MTESPQQQFTKKAHQIICEQTENAYIKGTSQQLIGQ